MVESNLKSMEANNSTHEGLLLALCTFALWEWARTSIKKTKFEDSYWAERRGRARVEKEMKKIANVRLNTSQGFYVQPIGEISSCYRQCIGTPRQGLLCPASRSSIKLSNNISPESMEGLQEFSHVWITFQFHLNSNTLKESKAFSSRSTFTGKITLPMLKKKLGVFATRSPHRPNPVGITLAQVKSIDKKNHTIFLTACDLVDGTPVLDVKPYVPAYDTVDSYRIPEWIANTVFTRNEVTIHPDCIEYIHKIKQKLIQYKNEPEEYLKGLLETLQAEVRSKFQTNKRIDGCAKGMPVEVLFDETLVRYNWIEERKFDIINIILAKEDKVVVAELMKLNDMLMEEEEEVILPVEQEEQDSLSADRDDQ